jgi:DNA-directed RNA polymerase subunit RPC12/RpoP
MRCSKSTHIHNFQKTLIENVQICKGCGWKLWIKETTSKILTEDIYKKFKKEFNELVKIMY